VQWLFYSCPNCGQGLALACKICQAFLLCLLAKNKMTTGVMITTEKLIKVFKKSEI